MLSSREAEREEILPFRSFSDLGLGLQDVDAPKRPSGGGSG